MLKELKDIHFSKFQGTGNDFILIDDREKKHVNSPEELFKLLCDRKFGIGADGVILITNTNHQKADFEMIYYNADGRLGSMCGNGGRCAVVFAKKLGIVKDSGTFIHANTLYPFRILSNDFIELTLLTQKPQIKQLYNDVTFFVDTGSPHHVQFVTDVETYNVVEQGRSIRNSVVYQPHGTNVNFVQFLDKDKIYVRTYERGVENETLSCGTGVVASVLCFLDLSKQNLNEVIVKTKGGMLIVQLLENGSINLVGPAMKVFEGRIVI
ncbi:MAG: diaminopimelate epimerase [Bacteroidia bacterium]|nr:diaminopimelate epimerase [Bacteroidia bacterium]MDW8346223.1 diaminopimelate epimerase [Bacteroidia bacterium]